MPALSLADQLSVLRGDPINEYNFARGRTVDIWIAPLARTELVPPIEVIYFPSGAQIGDTVIQVASTDETNLPVYRNEVFNIAGGTKKLILKKNGTIINATVFFTFFPCQQLIIGFEDCKVYRGLVPLLSAKEGAFTSASPSYAEAQNRNSGLYTESQKIKEDYTATITGDINYSDPALPLLESIKTGQLSYIFVQTRYSVGQNTGGSEYGDGILGEQYRGEPSISMTDNEGGIVSFTLTIKVSGKRDKYSLLV